jgi:flagellar hook-associated protein 1 FlgK
MTNVYGMLEVGRTSLLVQQKAMDVTSNNISNVNTPGYSRQRLNMEQNEPIRYQGGQLGTGVRAQRKVQRLYDSFLSAQINNENQSLGRWEAQKKTLEKVELMVDESTGYGLNDVMAKFWNSWQELANNPSGYTERVTLLANSQVMSDTFNKAYDDIVQVQRDTDIVFRSMWMTSTLRSPKLPT